MQPFHNIVLRYPYYRFLILRSGTMFQAYIKHVHSFLLIFPTTLMLPADCNTPDQDRLFPVHTVHIHYNFLPPCGNKTVPYPGHKVHSHDRSEFYLPGTLHNHFRYLPPFHTI